MSTYEYHTFLSSRIQPFQNTLRNLLFLNNQYFKLFTNDLGVAQAFDDTTHYHPTLISFIERYFKVEPGKLNEGQLKLACIPTTANLNYASTERVEAAARKGVLLAYPLTSVKNVFIFPGIPFLLHKAFDNIVCDLVNHSDQKACVRQVYLPASELEIVNQLNTLVNKYKDVVTFGSYPKWTHNYYKTRLTIEADSEEITEQVWLEIKGTMTTVEFDPNPEEDAMEKLDQLLNGTSIDTELKALIKEALGAIEKCYKDFNDDEVMMAVNGGKDCLTMLHLVHAYFQKHVRKNSKKTRIKALYIEENDSFPEVNELVKQSADTYDLDIIRVNSPMKVALTKVLEDKNPSWKNGQGVPCTILACFMGTRKNDPGGKNIKIFAPTSNGWPSCMRVSPILNWTYSDIWTFIRALSLPYPILYDQGYTSLGNVHNTKPNPHLLVKAEDGKSTYKPAYTLENGEWEREGRL